MAPNVGAAARCCYRDCYRDYYRDFYIYRVATRAAVVRALGDRDILSVIDAEHGIFSLDAACVITTHLSTFETRDNAVVVCAVSVALRNLDFAASVARRKTLRLALPHHMPSAHFLSTYETAASDDHGPLRAQAVFWMQSGSYTFRWLLFIYIMLKFKCTTALAAELHAPTVLVVV